MDQLYKDDQFMSGQNTQGLYFKLGGYVQKIFYDDQRMTYWVGCPECKKKVMPEREGFFRCETCNKTYAEQDIRVSYTLSCKMQDPTDGLIVHAADTVVGMKASDFRHMREKENANPDQLRDIMSQSSYNYLSVVVRAKVDDYMGNSGGDEVKFRYQAVRVVPMDFKDENAMLLKRLQMYQQK